MELTGFLAFGVVKRTASGCLSYTVNKFGSYEEHKSRQVVNNLKVLHDNQMRVEVPR